MLTRCFLDFIGLYEKFFGASIPQTFLFLLVFFISLLGVYVFASFDRKKNVNVSIGDNWKCKVMYSTTTISWMQIIVIDVVTIHSVSSDKNSYSQKLLSFHSHKFGNLNGRIQLQPHLDSVYLKYKLHNYVINFFT